MATVSQESVSHCLSTLCYCICGGREKDIKKDSPQSDENRLGKVCFSLNTPCQERVIFLVLCKLLAGCSSFAFQINCACFSPDSAVGKKVVSVSLMVNKYVLWCVFWPKHSIWLIIFDFPLGLDVPKICSSICRSHWKPLIFNEIMNVLCSFLLFHTFHFRKTSNKKA